MDNNNSVVTGNVEGFNVSFMCVASHCFYASLVATIMLAVCHYNGGADKVEHFWVQGQSTGFLVVAMSVLSCW